jgi:hypothetical protein
VLHRCDQGKPGLQGAARARMGRTRNPGAGAGEGAVRAGAISGALTLTPALPARAASPPARASSGVPGWPATLGPMGRGAFPPVAADPHPGPAGRRLRICLGQLEARGIIRACSPGIAVARVKRRPAAERQTLGSHPGPRRLTDTEMALERQFPGVAARVVEAGPDDGEVTDGVGSPHRDLDTGLTRRSRCIRHPAASATGGMQPVQPGAGRPA